MGTFEVHCVGRSEVVFSEGKEPGVAPRALSLERDICLLEQPECTRVDNLSSVRLEVRELTGLICCFPSYLSFVCMNFFLRCL